LCDLGDRAIRARILARDLVADVLLESLLHDLREPEHRGDGRAQLVTDVGEERALRAARFLGLLLRALQGRGRTPPLGDVANDAAGADGAAVVSPDDRDRQLTDADAAVAPQELELERPRRA